MKRNLRIALATYTACIILSPVTVFTYGGFKYKHNLSAKFATANLAERSVFAKDGIMQRKNSRRTATSLISAMPILTARTSTTGIRRMTTTTSVSFSPEV
ncbi:MAG: hypothetical protein WCT19_00055 [Candidatus Paceibacterota bacterium]|jgi:hypothetical protein